MPHTGYIVERCAEIEEMLDFAVSRSNNDPLLGAHLAAYISVLISGVVEDCIEFLVVERSQLTGDLELTEFVRNSIDRTFRNPNSGALRDLLATFSQEYKSSYEGHVGTDSREALGSIIRNRLSLAHSGRSQQDFTLTDVKAYFERVVLIIGVIEDILLPD